MKIIKITKIKSQIKKLIKTASFNLPQDIIESIMQACSAEKNITARKILKLILKNSETAAKKKIPLCQDCGSVYIDILIGDNVCIENFSLLQDLADQAVSEAYAENYLRKSIVSDPLFRRANTNENTPAYLSVLPVCGLQGLEINISLKGGGSENCTFLYTLNPSDGKDLIINHVVEAVRKNVTKACPPVIIGIGIGATSSKVSELARKAAFRNLKLRNSDEKYKALENIILEKVNKTGIGPSGLGGITTALAVNIEYMPCHMATLPVAVSFACHSLRRASSKILFP
ncbi:MAG: fumarate hydratase [Actinomycetota bacterium]|jgi:fumarate hydratase subunit alpha|nr:fumarate hydratase [Actinomycetota bacterium]